MTNEEAIEILDKFAHHSHSEVVKYPHKVAIEAFDMAIVALKAEPCEDTISRKHLLSEIDDLMKSPWFNRYKDDGGALHFGYTERKEAVEIVRDLCVKEEPPVIPKSTECKDCVSREAVIAVLDWHEHEKNEIENYIREIAEDINALPHVTPKPIIGHWLYSGENGIDRWTCDNCFGFVKKPTRNCPNCHAKMEGESE